MYHNFFFFSTDRDWLINLGVFPFVLLCVYAGFSGLYLLYFPKLFHHICIQYMQL